MSKYLRVIGVIALTLVLVSWGYEGHHAVGFIAQRHLTEKAEQAVKSLLGSDDMAGVSTYADDIKKLTEYKSTGALHYYDLPGGLTFDQFEARIKASNGTNIYNGIGAAIRDLQNPAKSRNEKTFALKILIHLVGDAHQPMHIGHEEDRGGNKVGVKFFGQNTDLHSLWDEGLMDHELMKYKSFAVKFDDATPAQIKKWQSNSVMIWLWESYQISNILYHEATEDPNFGEDYYKSHMAIVKTQIDKAGIRLAGLLNEIYK